MDFPYGKELTSLCFHFPICKMRIIKVLMILILYSKKMTTWHFKYYRRKYRILITQIILLKWEQKKTMICIYLIILIACGKYMDNIVHINKTPSYIKDTAKNILFPSPHTILALQCFCLKNIFLLICRDLDI